MSLQRRPYLPLIVQGILEIHTLLFLLIRLFLLSPSLRSCACPKEKVGKS